MRIGILGRFPPPCFGFLFVFSTLHYCFFFKEWSFLTIISHRCACDVPSHNYTWSFEPKLDWSATYPPAAEIFAYFDGFADKYNLKQYIQLEHQVIGAYWDSARGGYDVKIKDVKGGRVISDRCDILINAGGILNDWQWPGIPGLKDYKGQLLHTANWDPAIDLTGKHVGLIGNGSSGIQVLPAIKDKASKVTTFVREPSWISPVSGLDQHVFSEQEKREFADNPAELTKYRKEIESGLNGQFGIFLRDNQVNLETRAFMVDAMKEKLGNEYLESKLIPEWSVGCRRLSPGIGYLESLTQPNVEVVYGEIDKVTGSGPLCDNGKEYPVDVLICATGFNTTFAPRFPVVNHAGENLQDRWGGKNGSVPESYLGVAAADMPNYMFFLGPNCPIGNGPVLSAIEAQADWMLRMVDKWQTTNVARFAPKAEAVRDFVEYKDWFMGKTVWNEPCRSWYKPGPNAPITALWPGSTLHYIECMRDARLDDFDFAYAGNRFAWLGNGYSQTELDDTADWAYYIRDRDDDAPLSTAGRRKLISKSGTVKDRVVVTFSGKDAGKEAEGSQNEGPRL